MRHALVLSALLALSWPAVAQERRPATFDHAEASLASLIEFPELRGDTKTRLRCLAIVERSGKLDRHGCIQNDPSDQVFIEPVVKAGRKARLNPAVIDGRSVSVYLQYQVEFEQAGDEKTVRIFNNPGLAENVEAYGEDHVAAQRAIGDEEWQKVCPQRTRWLAWAKAHVDETGRASSFSIVQGENSPPISQNCRDAIVATLEKSRFTPALADGEPVVSSFIEPFSS